MYTVLRPVGDYYGRQEWAAAHGAQLYLEQHFNASDNVHADGALAIVTSRPLPESIALAREYATRAAEVCPHGRVLASGPVQVGGHGGGNVDHLRTGCPSALLEPGFVSCPAFDAWASTDEGLAALANIIVHVVRGALPRGGVVALSCGHVGKTSHPDDRGAPRAGGGWEADLAERVIDLAARLLAELPAHP